MSTPLRVVAFALGLAAVFGLALGVGRLVGPVETEVPAHAEDPHGTEDQTAAGDGDDGHAAAEPAAGTAAAAAGVKGLTARQDGHTLRLADQQAGAGRTTLGFTIEGADGRPVTEFDRVHEKRLHLIVLRRDLTGYQHLHPTLDRETGVWRTPVDLSPGAWRVFADFTPTGGEALTLAEDLFVPGDFRPAALPADSSRDDVDGYRVTLAGDTAPAEDTTLTLAVARDGRPVTDLQPYLGAHGHLVAIRAGDLGYLHVHPEEDGSAGPEVAFATSFPTEGTYRLFFDFKHADDVRTATFTVGSSGAAASEGANGADNESDNGADNGADGSGDHSEEEDDHGH